MGCAGSKHNHILTSGASNGHLNSPQKGFILFNANTQEYIRAYESQLKTELRGRCEPKLNAAESTRTGAGSLRFKSAKVPSAKGTGDSLGAANEALKKALAISDKELAIVDEAIDNVLKYALNEFDLETFKSTSNQLSMKHIRKDIMRNHAALAGSSATDHAFYKRALNTAIDEFGALVQERFIQINEFKVPGTKDPTTDSKDTLDSVKYVDEELKSDEYPAAPLEPTVPLVGMSLKEALEQARHNFYAGKMSMVCVTKAGSYVLKDVDGLKEESGPLEAVASEQTPAKESHEHKTLTMLDTRTQQTARVALQPQINIEDVDISATFKIIEANLSTAGDDCVSNESLNGSLASKLKRSSLEAHSSEVSAFERVIGRKAPVGIHELKEAHEMLVKQLRNTIDLIVAYSSSGVDENTLLAHLDACEAILEALATQKPVDYYLVDERLVHEIINLDYVKKEFASFLALVGAEASTEILPKIAEIEQKVRALSLGIRALPAFIFTSKGLPSPYEVNSSNKALNEIVERSDEQNTSLEFDKTNDSSSISSPSDVVSSSSVSPFSSPAKTDGEDVRKSEVVEVAEGTDKVLEGDEEAEETANGVEVAVVRIKRLSIDEELLNQIEQVDKKVKYLNETCSENEDDDDEVDTGKDGEIFFKPMSARTNDLHEEIKHISTVIQDLVHTINGEDEVANGRDLLLNPSLEVTAPMEEDRISSNSSDSDDKGSDDSSIYRRGSAYSEVRNQRKSITSTGSSSSIPVRAKVFQKQNLCIEDELNNFASTRASVSNNQSEETPMITEEQLSHLLEVNAANDSNQNTPDIVSAKHYGCGSASSGKKKFKSKLPIKKLME